MVLNLFSYFLRVDKRAEGGHARTMGTQRCPVETDRTNLATAAALRRSRPSVAGHACSAERDSVGVGHGSAVARAAQQISSVPNLPSPLSTMGGDGQAGAHPARVGRGVTGARETGPGGGLY